MGACANMIETEETVYDEPSIVLVPQNTETDIQNKNTVEKREDEKETTNLDMEPTPSQNTMNEVESELLLEERGNESAQIYQEETSSDASSGQAVVQEEVFIAEKPAEQPTVVTEPETSFVVPFSAPVPAAAYACSCSKTCTEMASCEEAYFQLNTCGCTKRDGDGDGIPCEALCGG